MNLEKVENTLLKSPSKRNEMVQNLFQKVNLRIVLNSNKPGRPEMMYVKMKLGRYVNLWIYLTLHIQTQVKMIINKLVK